MAHFSKSPPIPTPRTIGGQGLLPATRAVSATNPTMSSREADGVNIFIRLMFSLPNPLGATIRDNRSPSTKRVCKIAGVLSPVLPRRIGSATTEQRNRPSTYPCRTPSLTACSKFPWIWTSWPTSAKITAIPVSWQTGICNSRAASMLSQRSQRMAFPSGDVSSSAAQCIHVSKSSGSTRFASIQSCRTAAVICSASISLILFLLPIPPVFRPRQPSWALLQSSAGPGQRAPGPRLFRLPKNLHGDPFHKSSLD